jgi:hypothetical protein
MSPMTMLPLIMAVVTLVLGSVMARALRNQM